MSHYITLPINEAGVITDSYFATEIVTVCSPDFGTTDVFVYSHGWWTNADSALSMYNRFTTGFADRILRIVATNPDSLTKPPERAFGIGLHWPSTFTENSTNQILDKMEALSFYTMEKRADNVGGNALYTILRSAIQTYQGQDTHLRFHLIGHSFGCKVVCAALQQIALENDQNNVKQALDINVVLLQAAFKNNEFEARNDYFNLPGAELGARVLITKSSLDLALSKQFPLAQTINFFAKNGDKVAMGFGGPTDTTLGLFGTNVAITVNPGFTYTDFTSEARLVCADLTPIHQRNEDNGFYNGDSFGGHHSDINSPEIYDLIAGFLFK